MSLKSKLEAVIYAAEEPVTLPALAALFAEDALALKAERDAAAAAADEQARESANGEATLPLEDGFAYLGLEEAPAVVNAEPQAESIPTPGPTTLEPEPQPAAEMATAACDTAEAPTGESVAADSKPELDPEAEARRAARARDREVRSILEGLLDELIAEYASDERGIEIREIAGGYRMATKPACHDAVRSFVRSLKPPLKLSLPALETLAVVAYKQPVTAPEVSEIRGVESAATLGSLLSRKLIATAGRKQVIGRPILYKTTREFLLRFGLKDVNELPSMEEFEKMAAVELDDQAVDDATADANGEGESVDIDDTFERTVDATEDETATPDSAPASQPAGAQAAAAATAAAPHTESPSHDD